VEDFSASGAYANDSKLLWSYHGKYIYLNSTADAESALYRVRITDHTERVASLKDAKRPTSQSFGSWTGWSCWFGATSARTKSMPWIGNYHNCMCRMSSRLTVLRHLFTSDASLVTGVFPPWNAIDSPMLTTR
jgi:hypothetical protein